MKIYMVGTIGGFNDNSFAACMGSGPFATYLSNGIPVELSIQYPPWWRWEDGGCPSCRLPGWSEVTPWPMTWYEGSDCIGDFAGMEVPHWDMIAQRNVVTFFQKNDFFIKIYETFFEEVSPPSPRTRKPRYPIVCTTPYEGPLFWRFSPLYGVHINEEKSQKKRLSSCSVCGVIHYDTDKIFDDDEGDYFWQNFIIDEEEWNGLKLFGVFEFGRLLTSGGGIFLSEGGHDELLKQGFTNLKCVEVGRIEKAGHGKMKPYREQADYDFWKPNEFVPPPSKEKTKKRAKK